MVPSVALPVLQQILALEPRVSDMRAQRSLELVITVCPLLMYHQLFAVSGVGGLGGIIYQLLFQV